MRAAAPQGEAGGAAGFSGERLAASKLGSEEPGGAAGFPWREAMAAGLGVLRLSPAAFWAMSPRELAAALGPLDHASSALPRAALDEMMQRFPDGRR